MGSDAPTIYEEEHREELAREEAARAHPLVQAALAAFPQAKILPIRSPRAEEADAEAEALPEVEDEWDPFEDE